MEIVILLTLFGDSGFRTVPAVTSVLSQPGGRGGARHLDTAQTTHALIPERSMQGSPLSLLCWGWSAEEGLLWGNKATRITANRPFHTLLGAIMKLFPSGVPGSSPCSLRASWGEYGGPWSS